MATIGHSSHVVALRYQRATAERSKEIADCLEGVIKGAGLALPTPGHVPGILVHHRCMSRTNIDIDEKACDVVMQRYQLPTKREAVNFALRTLAGEPLSLEKARRLRGSGWDGDIEEMRSARTP
jgi:Arc/MetJ family transcription regulator